MKQIIYCLINGIHRINTKLLIFIILCLVKLGFNLDGNEEQYLAFSKQFLNPGWVPNSVSLHDVPGTRILFQYIFGFLLQYFSFETVAFIGRLISYTLFADVFGKIFKQLNINNLSVLFIFSTVLLSYQSIFAGGWMFGDIESKVFAYFFVLYSIYFLLLEKHFKAIVFSGIAVYWHILVGGWFILIYFVYLLVIRISFKQ